MTKTAPKIYLNSYNYRGYPLERALRKAQEYGYDGVDLWAGHYDVDTVEQTLRDALPVAARLGLTIPVLNLSGNVIGDDDAERQMRVRRLCEIVEHCAGLGVTLINGYAGSIIVDRTDWGKNGSAAATADHYARAAAAYQELGAVAVRVGVSLTLEVHMNTIHDTAASTLRLLDQIGSPSVGANIDPGNMYGTRTAEPALEGIALLAGRITFAHIKNVRRALGLPGEADYHWDLAHGDLDYFAIVQALLRAGFRGPYSIEYSGAGDRSGPSKADVAYLRDVLNEVAADEERASAATTSAGNSHHQEPL